MNSQVKLLCLVVCTVIIAGCTTTPEKYKKKTVFAQPAAMSMKADNSKMQAVATAGVGVAQQFVDRATGMTTQLVVEAEYFSANGRTCRRFKERVNGRDVTGVGCNDSRSGWIEIPHAALMR